MVRKDAEVNDTIKYIQNLLKTVGVTINITDKNEYKNNWYSVRIEINEMWGIGTNGKGVTYENALASALGEFMERLESGFLLDRLFPVKRNFQRTDRYASYWNLFEKSSTVLDESVIDIKCGTNGLSAGNSYEECFVQGSCEIFERMVLKEIYFNPHLKEKISIIKKEFYKNSEVYKYVSEIEKKGYRCDLLDCTIDGTYPVIGVLIQHNKAGKYSFSLGADPNFDICVERCITEIFQGKDFDVSFRHNMLSVLDLLCPGEEIQEYTKSLEKNSGKLPLYMLNISRECTNFGIPFSEKKCTNKELVSYISKNKCKSLHKGLWMDGIPMFENICSGKIRSVNA